MARKTRNIGIILTGIWLLLTGLLNILNIYITNFSLLMGLLAVAAGVLLLLGK